LLIVVIMGSQGDLLEVIRALRPPGRLAGGLDGREQERNQHSDDGDDDQQLDQRETAVRGVT